jgi:hypothetical protein
MEMLLCLTIAVGMTLGLLGGAVVLRQGVGRLG